MLRLSPSQLLLEHVNVCNTGNHRLAVSRLGCFGEVFSGYQRSCTEADAAGDGQVVPPVLSPPFTHRREEDPILYCT